MKTKWTKTWPKKPGKYWFYGWQFKPLFKEKPELHLAEVIISSNNIRSKKLIQIYP